MEVLGPRAREVNPERDLLRRLRLAPMVRKASATAECVSACAEQLGWPPRMEEVDSKIDGGAADMDLGGCLLPASTSPHGEARGHEIFVEANCPANAIRSSISISPRGLSLCFVPT
jgi:hypothetical protein